MTSIEHIELAMMKRSNLSLVFSLAAFLFLSCEDDEQPIKKTAYRPIRMEEVSYKRELIYDEAGQVVKVVSESEMPDGEVISTFQEFGYDEEGNITTATIANESSFEYVWENGRIVQTEELFKGIPFQRYLFSYQSNGLIREMLTYRYQNGTVKLMGKIVYAFDPSGNLSSVKDFGYYGAAGFILEMMYEYDRYDNLPNADAQFNFHTLNPGIQLHKNNPGRMVMKNQSGVTGSIEDYVYEYSVEGYPVKRESTTTFLHTGSTGSFETHYFFEEF